MQSEFSGYGENTSLVASGVNKINCTKKPRRGIKVIFSAAEDEFLINIVASLGGKWKFISKYFPNYSTLQVYNRYKSINPDYKRGRFTVEEDKKIIELVDLYSKSWAKISSVMKTRSQKQIRNKYENHLRK